MEYHMVDKESFHVIGRLGSIQNNIWGQCKAEEGFFERLGNISLGPSLGLCFGDDENGVNKYMVGVEADCDSLEGMDSFTYPKSAWLVFEARGPINPTLGNTWRQIYEDALPNCSEYRQAQLPTMEVYCSTEDMMSENYMVEIWIPVDKV